MMDQNYYTTIVRNIGKELILDYINNDKILGGLNGPYDDPETPVRNLCHLIIITSLEIKIFNNSKYIDILEKMSRELCGLQSEDGLFIMRLKKEKDLCNGVIGHSWVIEALLYLHMVFKEEKYLNTQKELEAMLVGYLGGRAAEEIVFDSVTTGASNDIEQATKVARAMITQYGMSKKFGLMGLATQENQYLNGRAVLNCGDNTATEVDHEVMELLRVSYEEAKRLISSHRKALDKIAAYLIRKETITGKEFMIIFRAVEKGMEVSDVLDAEGLKALDEAVKAEDKTDEANADTETAESAIAVPVIEQYR